MIRRSLSLLALIELSLCACAPGEDVGFVCPEGTVRQGDECVGEVGSSCIPACLDDEVCDQGSCILDGLPNLTGFWSGSYEVLFNGACSMGSTLLYGDNVRWDVRQARDRLTFVDRYGVSRVGVVTETGVRFEFRGTADNGLTYGLELDGIVSASGHRMLGIPSGTLVLPERPELTCEAVRQSFFDFSRSAESPTSEPPSVTGRWRGPAVMDVLCPDTRRYFRFSSNATVTLTTLTGGIVTGAFDLGRELVSTSQLDGRIEPNGDLSFRTGTLTSSTGAIRSLALESSHGESFQAGFDGALSWNHEKLAFRIRGEAVPDDGHNRPCPVQGGSMLLDLE